MESRRRRVPARRIRVGRPRDRAQPLVGGRARRRVAPRHRAGDAPAPAAVPSGLLGVRRRPVRERDPSGPDRRVGARRGAHAAPATAAPRRCLGHAGRHGLRPPRVRPVPRAAPDRVRHLHREGPALGADEPDDLRRRRLRAVRVRAGERAAAPPVGARRSRAGAAARDDGSVRPRRHARAGPRRRSPSSCSPSAGRSSCSRSGRRCRHSTSTSRSTRRALSSS